MYLFRKRKLMAEALNDTMVINPNYGYSRVIQKYNKNMLRG